jgi:AcrR family transcriptional regulator
MQASLNAFKYHWTRPDWYLDTLNMFKNDGVRAVPQRKTSEDTRREIFETALALFREQGFERTTMRDVAARVGVSLGAAYYYFASKDAIVGAYYDHVHDEHAARCREAFAATTDLRGRLRAALHIKVDVMLGDRKLLRALFRYGGDPDHELSWFGPATAHRRRESIGLFAEALAGESLPADLRDAAPSLLWGLHMGVLLFFVYDESPDQRRTRRLIDATVDLAVDLRRVVTSPLLRPMRRRLLGILGDAGLLPAPVAKA